MSPGKRGDSRAFLLPNDFPIFGALVALGTQFFAFWALKWVSLGESLPCITLKNGKQLIHSLAFGGRGMFTSNNNCNPTNYTLRCFSWKFIFKLFSIILAAIIIDIIIIGIFSFGLYTAIFDYTLGYPGEGHRSPPKWSKEIGNFLMATWNSRSLTFSRFKYCQGLNYDVLALTELWCRASEFSKHCKNPLS